MDIAMKFGGDWISGSHFILQKSNFVFIDVTAATLGQLSHKGHQVHFSSPKLSLSKISEV